MLNLLAFAIMVGLGTYFDLSAGYYVLLTVGSLLGVFAGFAAFSRGSFFVGGYGDVISAMCILMAAGLAIAIGWLHGVLWGVGGFVLFWPVMYRLGVKLLNMAVRMPES